MSSQQSQAILEIEELCTTFHTREGIVRAVDSVSFSLNTGETLGVVGESGCGKSVTALSVLRFGAPPRQGKSNPGKFDLRVRICCNSRPQKCKSIRGNENLHDFPGADDLAQSGSHGGAGRSVRPSYCTRAFPIKTPGTNRWKCWNWCGFPPAVSGLREISPSVVRGDAPTRDDRHGALLQSQKCSSPTNPRLPWMSRFKRKFCN